MSIPAVTFLGPQRHVSTVAHQTDALPADARLAVITAGWEEREGEQEELADHVQRECVDLGVYARVEAALEQDRDLLKALNDLRDTHRQLQQLYRLRLEAAMDTVYALLERADDSALVEREIDDALLAVAALDAHHLARVDASQAVFEQHWKPGRRASVAAAREAVNRDLAGCAALLVAGGHVGVLVERLRLLALPDPSDSRPIIAWSAGAMALTERIILFHDSPPQGRGHAEVLERGLGIAPGIVALPHASQRLSLDDPARVGVLARRCAPALGLVLDPGGRACWDGTSWDFSDAAPVLSVSGDVVRVTA